MVVEWRRMDSHHSWFFARSLNVVVVVVGCIYRERVCVWWGVHNTHIYHKKGTFVGLVVVALL